MQRLLKNKNFTYIKNIVVEKILETKNAVTICAIDLSNHKSPRIFVCKKAFLAAGAIFSTKILLNSLHLFNKSVLLKNSQYFMLPCIMKKMVSNVQNEKLHTLTQLSLWLKNLVVSSNPVHLQVYTFMDHYIEQFRHILKPLYLLAKPFLKPILNRMLVIQGYFHSNNSPGCKIMLAEDAKTLHFEIANDEINTRAMIKSVSRYLMRYHQQLGFFPLAFMAKLSKVLGAYHYSGSFPMRTGEGSLTTTDLLGRPYGMAHVHVVDATIFPTIPAQAITISIMANAYRIAFVFTFWNW